MSSCAAHNMAEGEKNEPDIVTPVTELAVVNGESTLELMWLWNAAAKWGVEIITQCGLRQCFNNSLMVACRVCSEHRPALLVNSTCGHSACAQCWARVAEDRLHEDAGPCCEQECKAAVSTGLLRICIHYSSGLRSHVDETFRKQDQHCA